MRIVDLHLVAVEKPTVGMVGDVKVDSRVAIFVDHDVGLKLEILELFGHVVEVAPFTVAYDCTVFDSPIFGPLIRFPVTKRFSVEQALPTIFGGLSRERGGGEHCQSTGQKQADSHHGVFSQSAMIMSSWLNSSCQDRRFSGKGQISEAIGEPSANPLS
jgi:hypothetical protein